MEEHNTAQLKMYQRRQGRLLLIFISLVNERITRLTIVGLPCFTLKALSVQFLKTTENVANWRFFYLFLNIFLESTCGKSFSLLLKIAMRGLDQILLATTCTSTNSQNFPSRSQSHDCLIFFDRFNS